MGIKYSSFIVVERDFWKECSLKKVFEVLYLDGELWLDELEELITWPHYIEYHPAVNPIVYVDYEFFKTKYGDDAIDEYVKTVMDAIEQSANVVYISHSGDSNESALCKTFPIEYAKALGKEIKTRYDYEFGVY